MVFFTWADFDEMDEVTGDGSAELLDDGSIEITFAYHNGDEAILKAKRDTSSTPADRRNIGVAEDVIQVIKATLAQIIEIPGQGGLANIKASADSDDRAVLEALL